jgi:hypothetical protein
MDNLEVLKQIENLLDQAELWQSRGETKQCNHILTLVNGILQNVLKDVI